MLFQIYPVLWCITESDCLGRDMSNISSTYLGIVIGAIIGAIISWWIYNRKKKTSEKQDDLLAHIEELEEKHEQILNKIQIFEENNSKILKNILMLEKKIDSLLEKNNLIPL